MASFGLQDVVRLYNSTMAQADPRLDPYPFFGHPDKMFLLIGLYLVIVLKGPKWMEPYKPFELRSIIIVYNFAMVLFNCYIWMSVVQGIRRVGYSIYCDSMEKYEYNVYTKEVEYQFVWIGWLFFMSKLVEFWDTFFFILRKKNNQITFLHVYHHATMTVFTWIGVKFLPGGTSIIYPLLNGFIHSVMYTYYGLAAFGPHMQKYLWWKKYLTRLQISQFLIFLTQGIINAMYECPYPKIFVYSVFVYAFTILLLFINFYVKAYRAPRAKTPQVHSNGKHAVVQNGHSKSE